MAAEFDSNCPENYQIRRAYALVIVNNHFVETCSFLPDRPGSEIDKSRLTEFCTNAGCTAVNDTDGQSTYDLTASKLKKLLKAVSQRDFSAHDAFVCFISSHGNPEGVYGVDGEIFSIDKILPRFKKCDTLAGKPKLFFIQNCRGTSQDPGVEVQADGPPNTSITLPIEADVLVAYSSVDGYESYRNVNEGSWFITVLTEVLEEHARNKSLNDILTIVNKRMADRQTSNGKKQMSCFTSSLRMCVHFTHPGPPPL